MIRHWECAVLKGLIETGVKSLIRFKMGIQNALLTIIDSFINSIEIAVRSIIAWSVSDSILTAVSDRGEHIVIIASSENVSDKEIHSAKRKQTMRLENR